MYRFFVDRTALNGEKALITGNDAHHIKNVLRMKKGDLVFLCGGDEWEYTCEISAFMDAGVEVLIRDMQKSGRELPSKITLYQCLPKKDKFELVIQKSVELGVFRIVPVISSRCLIRLEPQKAEQKLKRWNEIAKAAAKQSKRMIEPEVMPVIDFKEAVKELNKSDVFLMPYEKAEGMNATRALLDSVKGEHNIGLIIGPEGGFSDEEAALAQGEGAKVFSLGNRILRTETAGIAALSILMYLLEDD